MKNDERILIVGAGIGGLALARALSAAGRRVSVFERAPELREVGAGLVVQTAAMLALRHLELEQAVRARGHELLVGRAKTDGGLVLTESRLDTSGTSSVALHRGRLQAVLRESIADDVVHTGRAVVDCEQDAEGVTVRFADGGQERGSLLIGEDGLGSVIRRKLLGDTPLRYAGYTSFRGIARERDLAPPHEASELWGRGARFGFLRISDDETYWFAVLNAPSGAGNGSFSAGERARFSSFIAPVSELIERTPADAILRTDIFDRVPVSSWSRGRITLLGDAAHPTTPNLGQGACMAIEDAVTLAHLLGKSSGHETAFKEYEKRRVARTSEIVKTSFQFGRIAQLEGRVGVWMRNLALRSTPSRVIERRLREAAAFSLE